MNNTIGPLAYTIIFTAAKTAHLTSDNEQMEEL
jgi:hypothetical protein